MTAIPHLTKHILPPKIPQITFIALFFATMADMMGMGILLPLLPDFAENLGASATVIGIIFAGFALARGIFGPLFGRLSDQYGRKKFMLTGLSIYAGLSVGFIFLIHSLFFIALLWFLQGMASSMVTPLAQSYIGDNTPEGKEGTVMNLFFLGQFGGIAIGPVIGGYLVDNYAITSPFYVMVCAALVGLILVAFVVPSSTSSASSEKKSTPKKLQLRDSLLQVWRDRKMKGILIYILGRGFYRWGFNTLFPIYAITIASLSHYQIGIALSCYMLCGAVLQYPFGLISDRLSKYRSEMVLIGGLVAAISSFFVVFITNLGVLIVLVVIMGAFSAASRAATIAIRTDRGRVHGMGLVTGIFMTSISLGQVFGPVGFGAVTDWFNIYIAFYMGAFIGLITTIMAYLYLRKERIKKQKIAAQTNTIQ